MVLASSHALHLLWNSMGEKSRLYGDIIAGKNWNIIGQIIVIL